MGRYSINLRPKHPASPPRMFARKICWCVGRLVVQRGKCDNAAIDEHRQDGKNEDYSKNQDPVSHPAHFQDHLSDIAALFFRCHSLQPPGMIIEIIAYFY